MPAHDSVLRDHIDANTCHVIAQAVDLHSGGWMLSCQWLILSAFHRFSLSFFFFPQDLISIPTQSLRILSSFLPRLPCLFLFHQPISSGPSGSDVNYRKEEDVTAKHPSDGEEAFYVVSFLLFLSPEGSNLALLLLCLTTTNPRLSVSSSDLCSPCLTFPSPSFPWFFRPYIIFSSSHIFGCQVRELNVFCL